LFYSVGQLASAFSGLLAYLIGYVNTGKQLDL